MQPLTISAGSAMSPCKTTSWYHAAKSWLREVMGDSAINHYLFHRAVPGAEYRQEDRGGREILSATGRIRSAGEKNSVPYSRSGRRAGPGRRKRTTTSASRTPQ